MALGLFAQIGLITHLYLCPRLPFARNRRHRQCDVFTALIAQVEFPESLVPRVVALTVAVARAAYAFAPATFGLVREFAPHAPDAASSEAPDPFCRGICAGTRNLRVFVGPRPSES